MYIKNVKRTNSADGLSFSRSARRSETLKPWTSEIRGGLRLVVGLTNVDILTPAEVADQFSDAAPDPDGRSQYMVGLTLRCRALDRAAAALAAGGIAITSQTDWRIVVPASAAMGAALEFRVT